jgi:Tol biopolymer transport system component
VPPPSGSARGDVQTSTISGSPDEGTEDIRRRSNVSPSEAWEVHVPIRVPMRKRGPAFLLASVLVVATFLVPERAPAAATAGEGLIAFVREGTQRGIYTMTPSGSDLRRLTEGEDYRPRWSPDGTQIVFQRFFGAEGALRSYIYVMDADGSNIRRLTHRGTEFQPAWSPDGTRIAFGHGMRRRAEIFVMTIDGSEVTRLTDDRFEDSVPAWSPGGTTIAFTSRRHGNADLYLISPDGSDGRRLTHLAAIDDDPDWAPDGSRLVFQSNRGNKRTDFDLYSIAPDGTGPERLTTTTGVEWAPAWSPDGTQIAFTLARYAHGTEDIALLTMGSPVVVRFVISSSLELEPDWRPVVPS